MRECPRCKLSKSDDDFPKCRSHKGRKDGRYTYCKSCSCEKAVIGIKKPPKRTPPEGMKWCGTCKRDLPVCEFFPLKAAYDGYQKRCKQCSYDAFNVWRVKNKDRLNQDQRQQREDKPIRTRDYALKKLYKLPAGSFEIMFDKQAGRCAICARDKPRNAESTRRWLHVDHCHDSGIVRGLLCSGCNTAIGVLQHDPKILQSAIEYINKFRT